MTPACESRTLGTKVRCLASLGCEMPVQSEISLGSNLQPHRLKLYHFSKEVRDSQGTKTTCPTDLNVTAEDRSKTRRWIRETATTSRNFHLRSSHRAQDISANRKKTQTSLSTKQARCLQITKTIPCTCTTQVSCDARHRHLCAQHRQA